MRGAREQLPVTAREERRKGRGACTACQADEYGATVDRHKSLTNRVNVESVNMKYLSAERAE